MKILHVIPSYEPAWAFGGTVTATSNLCRALAGKGIQVTVYTTDADGKGGHLNVPLNQPVDIGGVKVWYFHCDLLPKKAFYSRGLAKKLKEAVTDFDIVHVSAIWQWIGVDVYRICKKQRIPYIITPHSSLMKFAFFSVGFQYIKKIYWKFWGRNAVINASAIQFLCEVEREESDWISDKTPSFIVPNGINLCEPVYEENQRELIRDRLNIPKESLVLLFLGRVHPKKQIELIIKAMPRILELKKDIYLIIVGPVEDYAYFENLKKIAQASKVNQNIIWNGPVKKQEVYDYYSASNIMVLPSIVEGISMAITEALQTSLPVLISNRVANYKEIGEDEAGIVVEPCYESVKNSLIQICSNIEQLKQLSQNARKSAENRYDINKVASLMIKAYEDVLTGKRRPELQWE
ncbi:MAG: glycosyltransferase [Nitrospirae bacterium]|nr:glycosyltransferase [Nitrospirota bacterium]